MWTSFSISSSPPSSVGPPRPRFAVTTATTAVTATAIAAGAAAGTATATAATCTALRATVTGIRRRSIDRRADRRFTRRVGFVSHS